MITPALLASLIFRTASRVASMTAVRSISMMRSLPPEPLITMAYTARTSTATLAPSTQTALSARAFYVGLDVEYGRAVQHIQSPNVDVRVPDPEHLHHRHPDWVGSEGRTGAEHSHLPPVVPRRLSEILG